MKYRIKKSFRGSFNFSIGEIKEFTDAEALRYALFIESIEGESVNSLDRKPNKQYKKGRKKG